MRRFLFFVTCFGFYALVSATYAWLAFPPHLGRTDHVSSSSLGCIEYNEGSWSIGVFYGDSPFSLKPIETVSFFVFPICSVRSLPLDFLFVDLERICAF